MQIKTETKVGLFIVLAVATFMFMILGIGVFRFNSSSYNEHTVHFKDVSGLSRKASVKIAGVDIGWVEDVELVPGSLQAKAKIKVNKQYKLYDNAYAVVRQEGLLGTKYLELIPGDPLLPSLRPGEHMTKTGRESVSVDELLYSFQTVARNVEEVTASLKSALAGPEREEQLKATVDNISQAAQRIDALAGSLETIVTNNEHNLSSIITDVKDVAQTLREDLPSLRTTLEGFSDSVSQDFTKIADRLSSTTDALADAADQARDGFENISSVAGKVDDGQGLLGKLINNEDMYDDIKETVSGIKHYLTKFDNLGIVIDGHTESMARPVDNFKFCDGKGYLNFRIHSADDYFYMAQLVSSDRGFMQRRYIYKDYYDQSGNKLNYAHLPEVDRTTDPQAQRNAFQFAPEVIEKERLYYQFGFQVGKIYKDVAARLGLFEGTFGLAVDYFLPIQSNKFGWTTTFEAFDFSGSQRFDREDRRPHLKWINKVYLFNSLYFTFGADDFVSKTNANMFGGFGIRFADDDLKYLLSRLGLYVTV